MIERSTASPPRPTIVPSALALALTGLLSLAACGSGDSSETTTGGESESGESGDPNACVEPGPDRFIDVSVSEFHGCAVRESGAVQCWGDDEYGKVSGAPCTAFTQVAAGREQTCGLRSTGRIECWGPPGAIKAPDYDDFVEVSTGALSRQTCGLRANGAIVCWGGRYEEGLLDPFPAGAYTQVAVVSEEACGVREDGGVTCHGWLGITPGGGKYKRIGLTRKSGCGILADDTLECWWDTSGGRLTEPPPGPHLDIVGGSVILCALDTASKPNCFTVDPDDPLALIVDGEPAESLSDLSASSVLACGLRPDKTMSCWGSPASLLKDAPAT